MSAPDPVEQALDSIAHNEARHIEWGTPEYRPGLCHPDCLHGWWTDEYGEYPCQACNPNGDLQ